MKMGTKIVGMGTHSAGTGTQPVGTGRGWGLTQWGRGEDGDRDNGDGWERGQILVPVQLSSMDCLYLFYLIQTVSEVRLLTHMMPSDVP